MLLPLRALFALQLAVGQAPADPAPVLTAAGLVLRARSARYQQDSLLSEYTAIAKQRMSAGIGVAKNLGLGPVGRVRLGARYESVARIGWHHSLGAWAELIGARAVAPIVGEVIPTPEDDDVALVLPYYPGRDRLWPMSELGDALPTARDWIEHPLNVGADSLYEFSIGDSLSIRLPDARVIRLRELRIRPRRPHSRLIVGSLWVDLESGSLVRAAYRPSVPVDLWPFMEREIGRNDRDKVQKFGPYTGNIEEIIVENGLYEGRFWLPRIRIAKGEGTAKGGRVTMSIEQTFKYERVKAVPPNEVIASSADTVVDRDPRTGRIRKPTWRGVQSRTRRCRQHGDSTSAEFSIDSLLVDKRLSIMTSEGVRFRVLSPCDPNDLLTSSALPSSIYAPSEELFTEHDLNALRKDVSDALNPSSQAKWSPQSPTLHYGLDRGLVRYNRIEGLLVGVGVERVLGNGYTAATLVRAGVADRQPNAELQLTRTNGLNLVQFSAFRRLVAANDWGNPLGVGASLVSLMFARDDGFYYRSMGAEITGLKRHTDQGPAVSWRLFAERQDSAVVKTQFSLAHAINGVRFLPNISAREGQWYGAASTLSFAWGVDPRGTQLSGSLRLEGAGGETSYGRGMTELRLAQGLSSRMQASITASVGNSVGSVPVQRQWYLGGPQTVHAYPAGSAAGDAFWLARAELTRGSPMVRPVVFTDIGWAGNRSQFARLSNRIASAGAGIATLDGLLRLDVGRTVLGRVRWRADLFVEIR